jgi:hypothetical protein
MPLVHWFRQQPSPELLDILLEPKTIQRGYFNERVMRRRLLEHRKGLRDRSWEIWHLLMFELWHRNFLEPALRMQSASGTCASLAETKGVQVHALVGNSQTAMQVMQ